MLIMAVRNMEIAGWHRKVHYEIRYYMEEACGACDTPQCSVFDLTDTMVVEVDMADLIDKDLFHATVKSAVLAHVRRSRPEAHDVPPEETVFLPTSF